MCLAFSFNIINRHELNHISTNINSTPGRREERTKMYGVSHYLFKSPEQPAEGCLSRAGDWPICVLALISKIDDSVLAGPLCASNTYLSGVARMKSQRHIALLPAVCSPWLRIQMELFGEAISDTGKQGDLREVMVRKTSLMPYDIL